MDRKQVQQLTALRESVVAKWMRRPVTRRRLAQGTILAAGLGAGMSAGRARAQEGDVGGTLTMLCWQGYDGPNAHSRSVEQTGAEINAIYLGSNDEIFATLRAGGLGEIDIVTPYHGYVKQPLRGRPPAGDRLRPDCRTPPTTSPSSRNQNGTPSTARPTPPPSSGAPGR